MRALVIGASGLVGGAVVRALERAGWDVTGVSSSRGLDVRDRRQVRECVAALRPDAVFLAVNLRGGVDACERDPQGAWAVNVEGTGNVVEAAEGSLVVYYSSDYVFDGTAGPYSEDDEPGPASVYGRTKLEGERLVRDGLIIRTTAVYGWDRASPNLAMRIWETLDAGRTMRVPNDQMCNPTLAEYLAEVTVRLVQESARGVWNVVGRDRMARSEMAKGIARAFALDPNLIVPVPTSEAGQIAPRPLQGGLKTAKLERFLGTEPLDFADQLRRLRRHWRADTHVTAAPKTRTAEAEQLRREILDRVRKYWELVHRPGPFVPYRSRIPYAGRVFGAQELATLVDSSLDYWLTLGPYGDLFERKMREYFGSRDFVYVNSGSTANLTAVMSLCSGQLADPLRPGDEVITPAVTFPTTLAPIVHAGLVPVFVDCEVETCNVRPDLLERAISKKTRAMVIPHTLGIPADMDVISELVRKYGLYLIEDCCDALGSRFRGRLCGTFGDLATLSFFPAHQISTGEGGGVVVNRAGLARIARSVRDWGRDCWCAPGESNTCGRRFGWQLGDLPKGYDHKYIYSNLGYNFKPTDMQAAIGTVQADRIEEFASARRRNFARLYDGLRSFEDRLILPRLDPRMEPSWFAFPITVREGVSRSELVHWLETANIETRQVFGGNILRQPAYRGIPHRVAGTLEETDRIMRDTFFIGVYPGLTDEMLAFVLDRFRDFFSKRRQ